jgi:hypothetical protein
MIQFPPNQYRQATRATNLVTIFQLPHFGTIRSGVPKNAPIFLAPYELLKSSHRHNLSKGDIGAKCRERRWRPNLKLLIIHVIPSIIIGDMQSQVKRGCICEMPILITLSDRQSSENLDDRK